jgi:hypothetical protein
MEKLGRSVERRRDGRARMVNSADMCVSKSIRARLC